MCGRFTLTITATMLQDLFELEQPPLDYVPRFNIAPTQAITVIPADGSATAGSMRWGLVPSWAHPEEAHPGAHLINLRVETAREKPGFRRLVEHRRCLIPADGFYEWRGAPGAAHKTPYRFVLKDRTPFALAGVWDRWHDAATGHDLHSVTILTMPANPVVARIHDRMPVMLTREARRRWVVPVSQPAEKWLEPANVIPAAQMDFYEVGHQVSSTQHEAPDCIVPVPQQPTLF